MRFLLTLNCLALLLLTCKSAEQSQRLPDCITSKIESLKNGPPQNPPSQVWRWETNGTIFYYINAACCDQFSRLYNDRCEIVCAPDGGMTGKGDGKCPEFSSDTIRTLIWKDERKNSK